MTCLGFERSLFIKFLVKRSSAGPQGSESARPRRMTFRPSCGLESWRKRAQNQDDEGFSWRLYCHVSFVFWRKVILFPELALASVFKLWSALVTIPGKAFPRESVSACYSNLFFIQGVPQLTAIFNIPRPSGIVMVPPWVGASRGQIPLLLLHQDIATHFHQDRATRNVSSGQSSVSKKEVSWLLT